jgi:ubiquinone/menaquinone biosynthesis C-methylase UbiE
LLLERQEEYQVLMTLQRTLEIVVYILGGLIAWQILIRVVRKLIHFPAPAFIGYFLDSERRRKMQPAEDFILASGIKSGLHVLEIGCGSGAFTTYVAQAVGPQGKVEALDIQPAMLAQLEKKLNLPEFQDLDNITLHQAEAYHLPFEDEELDLVYLITVLPEIPDQARALREISRVLKSGGLLAVAELLFDPDYPLKRTTIRRCQQAGFELQEVQDNIWSYTIRFKKPA